jgi:TRAP-type mannitol/chloroaromatic compound transport system permease small subunit
VNRSGRGGPSVGRGGVRRVVDRVWRGLDRVLAATGYIAGLLFLGLAFFISYDVVARKWGDVLGVPTTQVTDELSGYILVLAATWGFAYTLRTDAHVRIDVLLPHVAPPVRAALDLLAHLLMAVFACMFAWRTWLLVLDSWETGIRSSTYLLTPLWIPQAILSIGFSLLAVTAVFTAVVIVVDRPVPEVGGAPGAVEAPVPLEPQTGSSKSPSG